MALRIRTSVLACSLAAVSFAVQAQQGIVISPATATSADTGAQEPPASMEDALHAMFARAAIVFAGEVLSVQRTERDVLVRWRVDDAVRGATKGGVFDLHEWPGLWGASGLTRYTAGQRALVFLLSPSAAGYASPVDGADGIVPLRGDAAASTLDLRWVAGHVQVTDAPRLRPMLALRAAGGSLAESAALQAHAARIVPAQMVPAQMDQAQMDQAPSVLQASWVQGEHANSTGGAVSPGDTARADGAVVLGLLRAWQRSELSR